MIKQNTKITFIFLAIALMYALLGLQLEKYNFAIHFKWIIWNLFLAVLPLIFAYIVSSLKWFQRRWGILSFLFTALWLLFLPNSCYMITDLIHLNSKSLIIQSGVYATNMKGWIQLLYVGSGIFLAILSGLFSTSLIHQSLKLRKNKLFNFAWSAVISLLCGYGVYIGRFLRLNSWDVIRVRYLIETLSQNIDHFTVLFSCMIAFFFFIAYILFDLISHSNTHVSNPQ